MAHSMKSFVLLMALSLTLVVSQEESPTPTTAHAAEPTEATSEGGTEAAGGEHALTVPWRGWFVLASLIVLVVVLFTMNVNITAAITALAILYYLVPIIRSTDLFVGFGNGGVVAIELFYIIMYPMPSLPLVKRAGYFLMKGAEDHPRLTLLKLCFATMLLSMFFDNPPHVTVMTTIILHYCVSRCISPAMFLLPVNFAATLGNYSLTGTLSNLIIYGIIEELHLPNVEFFDLIRVNGPLILFELVYLVLVPPLLWGSRKGSFVSRVGEARFTIHLTVGAHSRLIGRAAPTVATLWGPARGLVSVVGVYKSNDVTESHNRNNEDNTLLNEGDRIVVNAPPTLIQSAALYWGYAVSYHQGHIEKQVASREPFVSDVDCKTSECASRLSVIVLGQTAFGLGTTIGERQFTRHYGLEIVACNSDGKDVDSEMDEHVLTAADSLLVFGSCESIAEYVTNHQFVLAYCIGNHEHEAVHEGHFEDEDKDTYKPRILLMPRWWPWGSPIGRKDRNYKRIEIPAAWRYMSIAIFIAIITLDALRVQPLEVLLLIGAGAYVLLGIISVHEAFHAIHLERYALAAFSFSLGVAFERSQFAEVIGESIALRHLTPFLNLLVISLLSTLFSDLATSEAAAQLMVPIITSIYSTNGGNLRVGLLVAMASVANTLWTPYGNVNNTIVYSTGVYRFRDFMYFGLPLSLINTVLVPISATIVFHERFN